MAIKTCKIKFEKVLAFIYVEFNSVLWFLSLLSTFLFIFTFIIILGSTLLGRSWWNVEYICLLVLWLELLFKKLLFSSASTRATSCITLSGAHIGRLSSSWFLLTFSLLIILIFFSGIACSAEASLIVVSSSSTLSISVITVNLLELGTQTFFCFRWWE